MIRRVNAPGHSDVYPSRDLVDDFDTEFDNLWSRAYGVAYVVLGDRGESEDVAQETLARALVRWKKVSAYAEPWVVRVAGNLAIDRVRKQRRARGVPPAGDVAPLDAQRVDLQRALLVLSPKQREVVVLRYLVDLPEAEVAQTLGCSVGTVKTHASRGLAALRRSLEVAG
jgi:RNA polymerase sigma-70 factor (sigma-E family)